MNTYINIMSIDVHKHISFQNECKASSLGTHIWAETVWIINILATGLGQSLNHWLGSGYIYYKFERKNYKLKSIILREKKCCQKDTCVNICVLLHVWLLVKSLSTILTRIRSGITVYQEVCWQSAAPPETFPTLLAFKYLLSIME